MIDLNNISEFLPEDLHTHKYRNISPKSKKRLEPWKEFNDTMIKLGFRWCIKHGIISYPCLSSNAIFLDRRDGASKKLVGVCIEQKRRMLLSRLIIESRDKFMYITIITPKKMLNKKYNIVKDNAYKNAILIALDFKFSNKDQFINEFSFVNDDVYVPLKN